MDDRPIEPQPQGSDARARDIHGPGAPFSTRMADLKRRLIREATLAIEMLEQSLDILWALDHDRAAELRRDDDRVDLEEIAIEQECREILALYSPVARQFRSITFVLKVNSDLERVADHACSIAKVATRLRGDVAWPTALRDMGARVPVMCHELLRVILEEDEAGARSLVRGDAIIDGIDHQLFDEITATMVAAGGAESAANGLLLYRAGRELERVGDLVANIAEEVVFLISGQMIRHQG